MVRTSCLAYDAALLLVEIYILSLSHSTSCGGNKSMINWCESFVSVPVLCVCVLNVCVRVCVCVECVCTTF